MLMSHSHLLLLNMFGNDFQEDKLHDLSKLTSVWFLSYTHLGLRCLFKYLKLLRKGCCTARVREGGALVGVGIRQSTVRMDAAVGKVKYRKGLE